MNNEQNENNLKQLLLAIRRLLIVVILLIFGCLLLPVAFYLNNQFNGDTASAGKALLVETVKYWRPADINSISDTQKKEQVLYGKELIAHTSKYFGPKGLIAQTSNGMNCQNCHLQAGTVVFGNNYGSVASLYPKFRARSGSIENIYKRVNDCFERSLNGNALDTLGNEMQAITAYINFIGSNVRKEKKAEGSGLKDITYLERATDMIKGKVVYEAKCKTCHQVNGQGLLNSDESEFTYPPLWGEHSYNDGAGLFRISNFAKYVKYNMPQGVTFETAQLTDEEAWDVAAFINSQTRPHKDTPNDWPDVSKKPIDHPFGPYADNFSEQQHKYGPFQQIADAQKKGK